MGVKFKLTQQPLDFDPKITIPEHSYWAPKTDGATAARPQGSGCKGLWAGSGKMATPCDDIYILETTGIPASCLGAGDCGGEDREAPANKK